MKSRNRMELYLLRHGIAEDNSSSGRDADRALTDEGRRKLREVLKTVSRTGLRPDNIVSSPLLRAKQTAEIAKEVLGYKDEVFFTDALIPESDPQAVWQEIRTVHRRSERIVLASHDPLISRCFGYFLGSSGMLVDFKKGAIARIDIDQFGIEPRGLFKWMLVPKLTGA